MTHQCTSCGSQTRAGAKFCHQCGTPIATTSLPPTLPIGPPPAATKPTSTPFETPSGPRMAAATEAMPNPSAYMSQAPQTYYAPPLAPVVAPKKSSGTLKIVLITLTFLIVLGIVSVIGAVFYVGKKASSTLAEIKKTGLPTVSDDPGRVTDEMLGVPIYPNAKREDTVSTTFGAMSGAVVTFSTPDEAEKVAEFYRTEFQDKEGQLNVVNNEGKDAVFQINTDDGPRLITIGPGKKGLTQIAIIIGKGVPGFSIPPMPPPPPPPPAGAAERRAREAERRALEQAEKVLRDLENVPPPPPPPPPRR